MTFLALDFQCIAPHQIKMGGGCIHVKLDKFNQLCGNLGASPLGKIGIDQLIRACWRCSPSNRDNSHREPSNSHNAHFGITYRRRPNSKMKQHHKHTPMASDIGVVFLSSLPIINVIQPLVWDDHELPGDSGEVLVFEWSGWRFNSRCELFSLFDGKN